MTAVVGLVHQGRAYLGGDSAAIGGWALSLKARPKVFRKGPYIVGVSGSPRVSDLVEHCLDVEAPSGDMHRHMVTEFVDKLRATLTAGGVAIKSSEQELTNNSFLLVGVRGRLFEVQSDYQVHEPLDGFTAIGCGFEPCLGVLFATPKAPPSRRLRLALEAAERFNAGVRGPFTYLAERTTTTMKKDHNEGSAGVDG